MQGLKLFPITYYGSSEGALTLYEEVSSLVRKYFQVRDYFVLEEGEFEFRVRYDHSSKQNFIELSREISRLDMTAFLKGTKEDAYILIKKGEKKEYRVSRLVYIFAFLTAASLIASGILQESLYACLGVSTNPWLSASLYVAGIVSIVGLHEATHYYISTRKGERPPSSIFLPGLPGITSFLPTLGSVVSHREPTTNKDYLFDITIAGPLAGVVASCIFFIAGQFFSSVIQFPQSTTPTGCENVPIAQINPNIVQLLLSFIFQQRSLPPGFAQVSPLTDVSVVGFLLSFISLLPCSVLDGGVLARATLGHTKALILGFASVILLLALDSPSYWLIAIALSFVLNRGFEKGFRDEVSELSKKRKLFFAMSVILALCCVPIPQNFFYFSL